MNGDRGIYLDYGGWGQARLGALRHKTLTNLSSGPHCLDLFFVLNPGHSLSDPHRSCCQRVKNVAPRCRHPTTIEPGCSFVCVCLGFSGSVRFWVTGLIEVLKVTVSKRKKSLFMQSVCFVLSGSI